MDDIPKFDPSKADIENFDPQFASPAQWAKMYRACGLQVVPGYMPREPKNGSWKRPRLPEWKKFQKHLLTDLEFDVLYGPNGKYTGRAQMGILTGPCSGDLLVIDLDSYKNPAAAQWWSGVLAVHNNSMAPETVSQRTGGGGRQLLFIAPPDWHAPTNRTGIGVDIRGAAGFIVAPPSLHDSGRHYEWEHGCAPWEIGIAEAPGWLLVEVEKLVAAHGGHRNSESRERAQDDGSDYDGFGHHRDGREGYMRDLIWAAVVEWRRQCPAGLPSPAESADRMGETWLVYERHTRSRLAPEPGVSNAELLEREGRGHSLFADKWRRAMLQWDDKVREDAAKPKPGAAGAGQGTQGAGQAAPQPPPRKSLAEVHAVFTKWFGAEYDLDAATAAMAAAASERLPGDPLWLLIVAGPGGAKTETVQALAGCGAHITSAIASEGALLSATPRRQQNKKSTGGLLRKIGDHGTLVIKDFTSILSADRNTRASVLAAIREIYDGRWERNVGTDGGQTLTWTGRIVIVAAVTTAWDAAHAVVASMGDRFALLRLRTSAGRLEAGRGAVRNTGGETAMRQELADAVGALVAHMDTTPHQLSDDEAEKIVKAADLVTLARSAVERDFRGDIEFAHDPEAPTRFAKQLVQLLRGAVAIGVPPDDAMRLVRRCACDSIPPLRRDILLDLAKNPNSRAADVRKRISQPRNTVRRGLECLHMLRALVCEETEETGRDGKVLAVWRYRLADGLDQQTLQSVTGHK